MKMLLLTIIAMLAMGIRAEAASSGSYQICAASFIEACKAQGKTEDERMACVASNINQCQDCALYEGGLKIPSLLPRRLDGRDKSPEWLDGTEGRKWSANFHPAAVTKQWVQTRKCFGETDSYSYSTPQHVYICVDTSKECAGALDRYYAFDKVSFGCAAENRTCPSTEEYEAATPPQYCWPSEYLQSQQVGAFLPGNRPAWDALRLKLK